MGWHCPPDTDTDTGFKIQSLVVWGWARYLLVTETLHNMKRYKWAGKKPFYFFETLRPEWDSNPWSLTSQAGSFNHCTRALAGKGTRTNPFHCYVVLSIEHKTTIISAVNFSQPFVRVRRATANSSNVKLIALEALHLLRWYDIELDHGFDVTIKILFSEPQWKTGGSVIAPPPQCLFHPLYSNAKPQLPNFNRALSSNFQAFFIPLYRFS